MRASFVLLLVLLGWNAASAADSTMAQRYAVSGSASLHVAAPAQESGTLRLRATLQPHDAALAALPPLQENARFALLAKVTAKPSTCYNDTIFRDDFDADGF